MKMPLFTEIYDTLYQKLDVRSPLDRRNLLIEEMTGLTNNKIHCFNCTGTCCTFSANSMQVTPLEAFEIIQSLKVTQNNLALIKSLLKQNIADYRLDHEIFLSKKRNSLLRKTYTCPFFIKGSKGCTIKKDLKPYGCLGFNPRIEDDNGSQCLSNRMKLEVRENSERQSEEKANQYLKQKLQLDFEKREIPKAVLELLEKIY
jgi:Fe-S-cluster containining protein